MMFWTTAAISLANFGTNAIAAIPALTAGTTNQYTSKTATFALGKIAPQLLSTNFDPQ